MLDSQLKLLLDDMTQYTEIQDKQPVVSSDKAATKTEPFDKFADSGTLRSFLQMSYTACLQR